MAFKPCCNLHLSMTLSLLPNRSPGILLKPIPYFIDAGIQAGLADDTGAAWDRATDSIILHMLNK